MPLNKPLLPMPVYKLFTVQPVEALNETTSIAVVP